MRFSGGALSVYHTGEKYFQNAAKLQGMEEFGRRLLRSYMPDQHRTFFRNQDWIYISAKDAEDQPWASLIMGQPGFVKSDSPQTLSFRGYQKVTADPVEFKAGDKVGVLGLELHTRRRNRMNGTVLEADAGTLTVTVDQSYGNCPKYIQVRDVVLDEEGLSGLGSSQNSRPVTKSQNLGERDIAFIQKADTFFIATTVSDTSPGSEQASAGFDMSHRGGEPGFVRVRPDGSLEWPEYGGNNLFMTLGNLHVNPHAGLLFIDFTTGDTLQLTGTAEVSFTDMDQTGGDKKVVFKPKYIVFTPQALPIKSSELLQTSPFNPPVVPQQNAAEAKESSPSASHADLADANSGGLTDLNAAEVRVAAGKAASGQLLKCVSVKIETPDIKTFEFELPTAKQGNAVGSFSYLPGQFATFEFDDITPPPEVGSHQSEDSSMTPTQAMDNKGIVQGEPQSRGNQRYTRTWTISSHPSFSEQHGTFTISVKKAGIVSGYLHDQIRAGSTVRFRGVGGEFTPDLAGEDVKKMLFLAGGIGITPIRAMLAEFVPKGVHCILLYAYRKDEDAAFIEEFKALQQRYSDNFTLVSFVSAATPAQPDEISAQTATSAQHEETLGLQQIQVPLAAAAESVTTLQGGFDSDVGTQVDRLEPLGCIRCSGRVSEKKLLEYVPDLKERVVFMCGPLSFQGALESMLEEMGFPMIRVFQESFDF